MAARRGAAVLAIVFLLALALRATVALQYSQGHPLADHPVIDEAAYDRWAQRIAGGELAGDRAFFQEPLYSYLLGGWYALFGRDLQTVRLVQALVGALTAVLVALLGRRLFGPLAGAIAGLAFALHRPALHLPSLLLKETLFLLVVSALALVLLATREKERAALRWWAVGALAAAGALLRGNLLVMGPFLCAWPLARALRARSGLALCARRSLLAAGAWLATLSPAIVHNGVIDGVWLPTSGAGTNFAIGNSLDNPWGRPGELDFVRGVPETEEDDWRREAERRTGRELSPGEVSSYWLGQTLASMRAHPFEHSAILLRKLALALSTYEVPDNHDLEWDSQYVRILRWPFGGFGLWGTLSLAGLLAWLASGKSSEVEDREGAAEIALLSLLYLGTMVLTMTSARIRLGLVPLLFPFAGAWVARLLTWLRPPDRAAREPSQLALLFASLCAAMAVVHLPPVDRPTGDDDWLGREFNLAVALEAGGDWRQARALALELDRLRPGTARVCILAAQCDWDAAEEASREGREEDARRLLASARDRVQPYLDPPLSSSLARFRADALAGRIAYSLGEWEEAAERLGAAREFVPDELDLALLESRARMRAAGGLGAADRIARIAELEREAESMEGIAADARARGLLEVERAALEFERARALLEADPARAAEAEMARESALDRLRPLAEDESLASDVRIEARLAAATIMLYLDRLEPARNHLRAVLELDPDQPRARLLLRSLENGH